LTIKELSRYKTLKNEAERLRQRLKSDIVTETVSGSSPEFPYCKHSVKVEGLIKRHQQQLHTAYLKAYTEQIKLEAYIQSVEDPLIRDIIRLRFEYGLKWDDVAAHIGGGNSADSLKMMICRYLKKHVTNVTN